MVGRFGPFEGPGILVVPIDKRADVGFELLDGGMNTSPEPLSGELSEPALDLIDPRRRSRREVDVIVRPPGEPPAIERIDQCVASSGVVRNVRSITAAT